MASRESGSVDGSPRRQSRVVIRFAGDSGDGMQLTGNRFAADRRRSVDAADPDTTLAADG